MLGVWEGDRDKKQGQRGVLQITAILHKPSRKWLRFHCSDIMGECDLRSGFRSPGEWEVTGGPVQGQTAARRSALGHPR